MPEEEDSLQLKQLDISRWFEFKYPTEEVVTANELHLPEDKDVIVNLRSQDVLHSFWIPK